jgi:hypothetical protein
MMMISVPQITKRMPLQSDMRETMMKTLHSKRVIIFAEWIFKRSGNKKTLSL